MIFDTKVNGIPCLCKVLHYQIGQLVTITGSGMEDFIPPEDEVFEYELLDRHKYRAKWLDRYATEAVTLRLSEEYLTTVQAENNGYY